MTSKWPFGTVLRLSDERLKALSPKDTKRRNMRLFYIGDSRERDTSFLASVISDISEFKSRPDPGDVGVDWDATAWVPVDE